MISEPIKQIPPYASQVRMHYFQNLLVRDERVIAQNIRFSGILQKRIAIKFHLCSRTDVSKKIEKNNLALKLIV